MTAPLVAMANALIQSPVGRLWRRLRPVPIDTPDTLKTFLRERAFLIAQKCAIDYCRGKTGLASYALFTEKPFLDALDVCRWEAFAAVLGDLLILVEGELRAHAGIEQRARLRETLAAMFSTILAEQPAPAHRAHGWSDAIAAFGMRLEAAGHGEPLQALDVADHSAKRLFETLPIHSSYRELDEEVVYGAVRFRMIAVRQEMQRRIAAEELAGRLTA
jgi:hypothetical protein